MNTKNSDRWRLL